jgi:integrase
MSDMPRKLPLNVVRQRTRHGKVVFYYREGHGPRVRLPSITDKAFNAAYKACLTGGVPRPVREESGTLAWLIQRYKESAHWANLRPSTRRMRDNILKHVIEEAGHVPFSAISQKHINIGVDRRKPHAGNTFRKVMSQIFKWAVSVEHVTVNPATGATKHVIKSKGHHSWTVDEVKRYHTRWAVGTRERLAMDLALFTGLRRSDLVRLGRQHVSGGIITIRTEKTDAEVTVPIFPILQRSIDATQTSDLAFLATASGKPFKSAASLGNWFRKACLAAEVPGRLHGLRKAGATIAADAGATPHELMAMFGWTKLSEAERYTEAANRKRLSASAAGRIADSQSLTPDTVRDEIEIKAIKSDG